MEDGRFGAQKGERGRETHLNSVSSGLLNEALGSGSVVANVLLDLCLSQRAGSGSSLEGDVGSRNDVKVAVGRELLGVGRTTVSPELKVDEGALGVDWTRGSKNEKSAWRELGAPKSVPHPRRRSSSTKQSGRPSKLQERECILYIANEGE